jgi:hypothetical protein
LTFFVQKAGAAPPTWRSLQAILRERHEQARQDIDEAIKAREAVGVPLDNHLDWRRDVDAVLAEVASEKSRDKVHKALLRAVSVSGRGLRPLAPYVDSPLLEPIEVRMRALSKSRVMDLQADLAACAYDGEEEPEQWRATGATMRVMRAFVAEAIAGIRGAETDEGVVQVDDASPLPEVVVDALDRAGLIDALFIAARDWQSLSPPQRARFASSAPSMQAASTALDARPHDDRSLDARGTASGPTSLAIACEKPASAQAVTSATTSSSLAHSTSTADAKAGG